MSYEIVVTLPADRSKSGSIELRDGRGNTVAGPFPCLGLADRSAADAHGNHDRIPTLPYGNTPTGDYSIDRIVDSSAGTRLGDARSQSGYLSYGREGVIVMTPTSGDALSRPGIWIHSGDLSGGGELRPTNGCIRVEPGTMTRLRDGI